MLWRDDEQAVYVLDADGAWVQYADTWDDSQPADDPALVPPDGLWQPVRGFGKVWREQLGGPQSTIGWALAGEMPFEMQVQSFAGGQMLAGPGESVFVLYTDGSWDSQQQP